MHRQIDKAGYRVACKQLETSKNTRMEQGSQCRLSKHTILIIMYAGKVITTHLWMFLQLYALSKTKKMWKNEKLVNIRFFSLFGGFFSTKWAQLSFFHHILGLLTCLSITLGNPMKKVCLIQFSYSLSTGIWAVKSRATYSLIRSGASICKALIPESQACFFWSSE